MSGGLCDACAGIARRLLSRGRTVDFCGWGYGGGTIDVRTHQRGPEGSFFQPRNIDPILETLVPASSSKMANSDLIGRALAQTEGLSRLIG
jgi:hypothetical protein